MTPPSDVIQFTCQSCGMSLTVPLHLAGISGPCPQCSATITSPQAPAYVSVASHTYSGQSPAHPPGIPLGPTPTAPTSTAPELAAYTAPPPLTLPSASPPQLAPLPSATGQPPLAQNPWPQAPSRDLSQPPQPEVVPPAQSIASPPLGSPSPSGPGNWAASNGIGSAVLQTAAPLQAEPSQQPSSGTQSNAGQIWGNNAPALPSQTPGVPAASTSPQFPSQAAPPQAATPATAPANSVWSQMLNAAPPQVESTTASQPRSAPPVRERAQNLGGGNRRGAFLIAFCMGLLALGIVAYFFRKEITYQWQVLTMKPTPADHGGGKIDFSPGHPQLPAQVETPTQAEPVPGEVAPTAPAPAPPSFVPDPGTSQATPPAVGPVPPTSGEPAPPMVGSIPKATPAPVEPPQVADSDPASSSLPIPPIPGTGEPDPAEVSPSTSPGPPVHIPEPEQVFLSVSDDARPAADALQHFFAAPTWQERLKYVQRADRMASFMENYHKTNPDGPISVTHIQLIPRRGEDPNSTPRHCVFQVAGGAIRQPVPVMVEESSNGWKVDWLTFIQFKDELLKKFCDNYVESSANFHVLARRSHYFDEDVPDVSNKLCFELTPPMPGYSVFAFADKGTPTAQKLGQILGWDVPRATVMVTLRWRKEDRYQWLELVDIPQDNWRTPGGESDGANEEVPKAKPASAKAASGGGSQSKQKARPQRQPAAVPAAKPAP